MPPYPLFTFIGFSIHFLVTFIISLRLLRKRGSVPIVFLGIGIGAYALDFGTILTLFYLFPNTLVKTQIFIFIASVVVPIGTVFLIMSVFALSPRLKKYTWVLFVLGSTAILYSYFQTLHVFESQQFVSAYVHPAYPAIIAPSQAWGGAIATLITSMFFLYNAFQSTLFIKRRAFIIGIAALLQSISSYYWISTTSTIYIFTHIVGPLGSILLAVGFLAYKIPEQEDQSTIYKDISS